MPNGGGEAEETAVGVDDVDEGGVGGVQTVVGVAHGEQRGGRVQADDGVDDAVDTGTGTSCHVGTQAVTDQEELGDGEAVVGDQVVDEVTDGLADGRHGVFGGEVVFVGRSAPVHHEDVHVVLFEDGGGYEPVDGALVVVVPAVADEHVAPFVAEVLVAGQ